MDKRQSLQILINHSFFLNYSQKQNLLNKLNLLQKEEIELLGRFLAKEKKRSLLSLQKEMIELKELEKLLSS